MSRTMNRVELLGRVGTEPDLKYSQNGTAVCQLRLATDRRRQNGETEADWHSVVCWGKLAEAVSEYVQKGNRVFVAGSLAQNSYEREDGERVYRTEVHAQEDHLPRLERQRQLQRQTAADTKAAAGVADDQPF